MTQGPRLPPPSCCSVIWASSSQKEQGGHTRPGQTWPLSPEVTHLAMLTFHWPEPVTWPYRCQGAGEGGDREESEVDCWTDDTVLASKAHQTSQFIKEEGGRKRSSLMWVPTSHTWCLNRKETWEPDVLFPFYRWRNQSTELINRRVRSWPRICDSKVTWLLNRPHSLVDPSVAHSLPSSESLRCLFKLWDSEQ